jgi:pimeloyl-ACP methyl ester carboxylesterase
MVSNEIIIDAGIQDQSRPSERPPKTNAKQEFIKKLLHILQYPFPGMVARFFWKKFRKPGRSKFNDKQKTLIERAETGHLTYKGCQIVHYRWGQSDRKILLSHGWNSKIADFRKMIEHFVEAGFQVEGVDMKAHGQSEGDHTALPEIMEILSSYYEKHGPYEAVIGYSIGGLGAGLVVSNLPESLKPQHLIMIAAPPYTTYFFEETIAQHGFRKAIYHRVANAVKPVYGVNITDLDIRGKEASLANVQLTFVYDENDTTVTFDKGLLLKEHFPKATFVHTLGLGHYKVIAFTDVNDVLLQRLNHKTPVIA